MIISFTLDMLTIKEIGIIIGIVGLIIAVPNAISIYSTTQSGYSVTINIGNYPWDYKHSYISIKTENGWEDSYQLPTAGDPSVTFDTPTGYGYSVQVCAKSAILLHGTVRHILLVKISI
jgi:hypothetical protein